MGFFDEFKRLAHPYPDEEEEDYGDGFDTQPRSSERRDRDRDRSRDRASRSDASFYSDSGADDFSGRRGNKVVNIRTSTQLQVVLVRPDRFDNASEIADHLRERRTVVLNLESTDKETSRRLLDFLAGVVYATGGKIKRVDAATYIATPYNVDILGDLIDELENNGLYF